MVTTNGDDFEQVWHAHRADVWKLAVLLCDDVDVAEDVVGAAVARAWRGWTGRRVLEPRAYLRRAVVNEATDRFRSRRRDRRWAERRTGEGRATRAVVDDVADRVDLAAAMAGLPIGQRAVIVLRFWADLSEAEIARTLGISAGTVKSRTSRAMAALAVRLDSTHPETRTAEVPDA